ncbi:TetR/AcrR family transcriptional regulator [Nioella sediminis]|uniref:TetR/AcrR family transcriptional regulator n=1 Tax=Nioella sediminis TaxID=1912092 RepID=UPI0013148B41|nr:helix-turn-helix domain-containing protein [Nioella sediminis]
MKANLLTHAEALARSRGIDAFSYADLAAATGIRKASVHYHFATKADLTLALIEDYAARVADRLNQIEAQSAAASGALRDFLQLYHDALGTGDSLCLCVAFSAATDSLPEASVTRVEAFRNDVTAWLNAQFDRARQDGSVRALSDPAQEAAALFALVEGAQLVARAARNPDRFTDAVAHFSDRLLMGAIQ